MQSFKELYQSADWKSEKHVPFIDFSGQIRKNENTKVTVTIGKEIPHPNTSAHHIQSVSLYFKPEGDKFPYRIGSQEFYAHGDSVQGPDTSTVYTHSEAVFTFRTGKSGTLFATCYCNIHGLWENSKEISIA